MRIPAPLTGAQKRELILSYQKKYGFDTLVETGTLEGEMINACKGSFARIYSIELLDDSYNNAVERFKDDDNVFMLHGNSSEKTRKALEHIEKPSLFWLDAHDGIQSPVLKELEQIFEAPYFDHVILIDDMRNFEIGRPFYPTRQEIIVFVHKHRPDWQITITDDIMEVRKKSVE